MKPLLIVCQCVVVFALCTNLAQATVISSTLGNDTPSFSDGDTPGILEILAAVSGQPAPFDAANGNDPVGPNFSAMWAFNYGAIAETITAATITIGIQGHESASPGSQLAVFGFDGNDLTSELDVQFEGHGGATNEYNVYTVTISGAALADLVDGLATFSLDLQGPVLQDPIFGGDPVSLPYNGAFAIFSTLEITTEGATIPQIPEPASVALFGLGLAGFVRMRQRLGD